MGLLWLFLFWFGVFCGFCLVFYVGFGIFWVFFVVGVFFGFFLVETKSMEKGQFLFWACLEVPQVGCVSSSTGWFLPNNFSDCLQLEHSISFLLYIF